MGKPIGLEAEILVDGTKTVKKMFESNQAISMHMKDLHQRGHEVDLKSVVQKYNLQNAYILVQSDGPVREIRGTIKGYTPGADIDVSPFMNQIVSDMTTGGLEAKSIDLGPERPGLSPVITVRFTCSNLPTVSPVIPALIGRTRSAN